MSVGILIDIGRSLTSFKSEIVSIDLDVTQDEAHEWTNDVTTNPVENGSPIADHIMPMPDKVTITGMVSNSAISDAAIQQLQNEFGGVDGNVALSRVQTTFDLLRQLKEDRKLVTVYTRYKVYTDMALNSVNIPRSASIGDSINFTASFTHIRIVNTQRVDVPPGIGVKGKQSSRAVTNKTMPQKDAGNRQAIQGYVAPKSSSVLSGIRESLTSKGKSVADGIGIK